MQYQANAELAMILPLPTPPSTAEDAVRFIDLSGYPTFFHDMEKGFAQSLTFRVPLPAARQNLQVYDVGSFQASFVPDLQDFSRLDERFRLPAQIWDQLPRYSDNGFAVFRLKAGAKNIHPMAFSFPRRNPNALFFPTIHIHDGNVEAEAHFDHALYCQTPHPPSDWQSSQDRHYYDQPLAALRFMDCDKTQGMIDPMAVIHTKSLRGIYPNNDVVIQDE